MNIYYYYKVLSSEFLSCWIVKGSGFGVRGSGFQNESIPKIISKKKKL
jgi:hypothetical protein